MNETAPKQMTIDVGLTEQDLLLKASQLIEQAMMLNDSSSVRKFEFLIQRLDTIKILQLLQASGNSFFLKRWDNLKIESHKSAWTMTYKFNYPPS